MLDGALTHNRALGEFSRRESRAEAWDALMERTANEMAEQLLAGETIRCATRWRSYEVSFADFVLSLEEAGETLQDMSSGAAFRHLHHLLTEFCNERAEDRAKYLGD